MTLAERIAANTCRVKDCQRVRVPDSLFCRDHLNDMWLNRLDKLADGSFVPRRTFVARDMTRSVA